MEAMLIVPVCAGSPVGLTWWSWVVLVRLDWSWFVLIGLGWSWFLLIGPGWSWFLLIGPGWSWFVLLGLGSSLLDFRSRMAFLVDP